MIIQNKHDNLEILKEIVIDEAIDTNGQIYTKVHYGQATHIVFTQSERKIRVFDIEAR